MIWFSVFKRPRGERLNQTISGKTESAMMIAIVKLVKIRSLIKFGSHLPNQEGHT